MIKLNVINLLDKKGKSKYWLFNNINNIRSANGSKIMSYTNFLNLIEQKNQSIRYQDIDELCSVLECDLQELLLKTDN